MSKHQKVDDGSFVFQADPQNINVEEEGKHMAEEIGFNPEKLAQALVTLGQKIVGVELYDYQTEPAYRIFYSLLVGDGAEVTLLFARQSGKSEVVALVINTLAILFPVLGSLFKEMAHFARGVKIGVIAPQSAQVETVYSRCMERILSEHTSQYLVDPAINALPLSTVNYKLTNGSFVTAQSGAKQSKIESKTYNIVFVDEAQDMDTEKVQKSIIPMTASCLCAGQKVYNSQGIRISIENFESTHILGYDLKKSIYDETVFWKQNKLGRKECFRIITNSGRTLECSHDHPILYKRRDTRKIEYIKTEDLSVGTQVAIIDEVDRFGNIKMFNPRLVGMLIGDGSYTKDVCVTFSNADDILWEYVEKTENPTYTRSHITKDGRTYKEARLSKTNLCAELKKLGIHGQVGKSKTLPVNIDQYAKEDICELIGGLFDTDGTVLYRDGRRGTVSITSSSKDLMFDVMYLLDKLGIHGIVVRTKPNVQGYAKEKSIGAWKYSINEKISIEKFHKNIKLLVPHKQENLNNLVAGLASHKSKRQKNIEGLYFERVTAIIPIGEQSVYNLTADEHNNYIANGIVTHNTFGTIVRIGTTNKHKGDFYHTIKNNKLKDAKLTRNKRNHRLHFEYDYKAVVESKRRQFKKDGKNFHLLYEKAVERDRQSMGANSDAFRMSYNLEWLFDVGMFITESVMESNLYKNNLGLITPNNIDYSFGEPFIVAGLDIASARASTVFTVGEVDAPAETIDDRPIKTLYNWLEIAGLDYEKQFEIISEALIDYRVQILFADYTGVGRPFVDRLMYHFDEEILIIPCTFTPLFKSDMWKRLDEDIHNSRLNVPANPRVRKTKEFEHFEEQMLNLQKIWKANIMVCEKGQGFKDDFCLSLDTEILTNKGFKKHNEVTVTDLIATYNPETKEIEYQEPSRHFIKDYEGLMYHLVGEHAEYKVTENHKMSVERRTTNGKIKRWVNDTELVQKAIDRDLLSVRFPVSGYVKNTGVSYSNEEIELIAWMVTEGWKNRKYYKSGKTRYFLAQSYKRYPKKCASIERILNKLNLSYGVHNKKNGMRFYQFKEESSDYLVSLLPDNLHSIPQYFLEKGSLEQLNIFYNTLMDADGCWSRHSYSNINKDFIDKFAILCHLIGKAARVEPRFKDSKFETYVAYVMNGAKQSTHKHIQEVNKYQYKGQVWCVTVPNGFIITRLNNKISITGNCDSLGLFNEAGNYIYNRPTDIEVTKNVIFDNGRSHLIKKSSW